MNGPACNISVGVFLPEAGGVADCGRGCHGAGQPDCPGERAEPERDAGLLAALGHNV